MSHPFMDSFEPRHTHDIDGMDAVTGLSALSPRANQSFDLRIEASAKIRLEVARRLRH